MPLTLRDLDLPAMTAALAGYGIEAAKAARVFAAVQRDGVASVDGMDWLSLPSAGHWPRTSIFPELEIVERRRAADGFVKYLFGLPEGGLIEAVRIPLPDPDDARALKQRRRQGEATGLVALPTAKYTLCISSQSGCTLACDFCATGRLRPAGGVRNLAVWEMLAQVRAMRAEADHPVAGVLFLGMGEPLLNYDNVIRTAQILSHPAGPAIAGESISISTVGVAPAIRRFAAERHRFRLDHFIGRGHRRGAPAAHAGGETLAACRGDGSRARIRRLLPQPGDLRLRRDLRREHGTRRCAQAGRSCWPACAPRSRSST